MPTRLIRFISASFLIAAVGLAGLIPDARAQSAPAKLLIQSVCVFTADQQYIAIYNPNDQTVDLSNYYITDAVLKGDTSYFYIYPYIANRSAGDAGGGMYNDFHMRFPAGATIAPHDTIAIAHQSAPVFKAAYGRNPAYEVAYANSNDPVVPDMRPAFTGSLPASRTAATLDENAESVVLYYWDGQSDLVTDVDYVVWGGNTAVYVDKTGLSLDGPDADATATAYKDETPAAQQIPVVVPGPGESANTPGNALRREDFGEGTQKITGGNGVGGRDETSEPLNVTWSYDKPAVVPFRTAVSPAALPTANAGGPYTGTANTAINLVGTGSTAPAGQTLTNYAWNFGDGESGTGATTTHIYGNAGTFTVTLTVTASGGGIHAATTTATISPGGGGGVAEKLMFQAVCVTGNDQEYLAVYNPNNTAVDLSNYYITDAIHFTDNTMYTNIVNPAAGPPGGPGGYHDFHIRFPAGAMIAPHDTIAVAHRGAGVFEGAYGRKPAYEVVLGTNDDPQVPNMRPAFEGSIDADPTLTNGGESVVLYYWDGLTDLVTDIDYVVWGPLTTTSGSPSSYLVNKTGISIDGPDAGSTPSSYLADTPYASQSTVADLGHAPAQSFIRTDFSEGTQQTTGGNGVGGRDETSENLRTTWTTGPTVVPFVKAVQPSQLTAQPGGPYTGVAGTAISFNGSGSTAPSGQTITAYAWNFGDGGTGTGVTTTHTYANAGTYTVTLTVTGSGGGTHAATTTAVVTAGGGGPTANAGGPYTGTPNSPVNFSGTGSTAPAGQTLTNYAWNFGDGGTGTGATASHTYTAAGTYTVTLTVTASGGGTNAATTTATISSGGGGGVAEKLMFQAVCVTGNDQEYLAVYNPNNTAVDLSNYYITDAIHFTDNTMYTNIVNPAAGPPGGPGGFHDFHIRFPAGASIAPHDTIAVAHRGAGVFEGVYGRKPAYEVVLGTNDDPQVPNMRPAFEGSIDPDPTLTNGGESVVLYYWDGLTDLVTDIDYVVWGPLTTTSGSPSSYLVNKTGISIDGPDAGSTPSSYLPDTPYASQSTVADAGHAPDQSFIRSDFSEGTQHTTGGNGVGGRDETSENLRTTWTTGPTVVPFVKAVQPSQLTARPGGPYTGVAGTAISFNGSGSTAPSGQTITAYAWNFGDGGSGTGVTATHTYTTAGSYTVTLTVTGSGGGTHAATTTATVTAAGQLTAVPGGPYTGTAGTAVNFNGSGSQPAAGQTISAYAWNFGDGGTGTGATVSHTYTAAGTYTVTLTVTGSGGGTHSANTTATITAAQQLTGALQVPARTFLPTRNEQMKITVNPAGVGGARVTLRIFDLAGREVKVLYDGDLSTKRDFTWNGRDDQLMLCPAGTYICHLEIRNDTGKVHSFTAPIVVARMLAR